MLLVEWEGMGFNVDKCEVINQKCVQSRIEGVKIIILINNHCIILDFIIFPIIHEKWDNKNKWFDCREVLILWHPDRIHPLQYHAEYHWLKT